MMLKKAVAGAISQEPDRLDRIYGRGGSQRWIKGANSYTAKSDWNV